MRRYIWCAALLRRHAQKWPKIKLVNTVQLRMGWMKNIWKKHATIHLELDSSTAQSPKRLAYSAAESLSWSKTANTTSKWCKLGHILKPGWSFRPSSRGIHAAESTWCSLGEHAQHQHFLFHATCTVTDHSWSLAPDWLKLSISLPQSLEPAN